MNKPSFLDISRDSAESFVDGSSAIPDRLSLWQRILKRGFDLTIVLLLLPFAIPLAVLIATAIKLDSKGPALFRQERIGLGNRRFEILKFRTMHSSAAQSETPTATSPKDPRITRVGGFLRQTSLDELPQFFNVLTGDMSVVGPRPHTEQTAVADALLWEIDPRYLDRHAVKPGITGLAQVRGFRGSLLSEKHLRDRLDADLEYIEHWSVTNDLLIALRTPGILVHRNAF